jgi:UDP-2,3-diacylglucosamine pyrophosphatase LpxH
MLVFISDLHYRDNETFTVSPKATEEFLKQNLIPMIEDAGAKEVTVVFLGDLIDISRSQYWVDGRSKANGNYWYRPWSNWKEALAKIPGATQGEDPHFNPQEFEKHILNILGAIRNVNQGNYRLWRDFKGKKEHLWKGFSGSVSDIRIKFEFVPGNHDRLAQYSEAIRAALTDDLDLDHNPADRFPWVKEDEPCSVVAFHGQAVTRADFGCDEVPADLASSPWYDVPGLGDAATVHFGIGVVQEFASQASTDEEKALANSLGEMDLVRPQSSVLRWLARWGLQNDRLKPKVDSIVVKALNDMLNEDFVRWRAEIGCLKRLVLKFLSFRTVEDVMHFVEKQETGPKTVEEYVQSMVKAITQPRMTKWLNSHKNIPRNIVSGHTHVPVVIPIKGKLGARPEEETVYFNTGTWLPVIEAGADSGFTRRNKIVHVTFYKDGEDVKAGGKRTYWEFWEGNSRDG